MEPRRDRIGTSAVANTTPHGAGALKIGIRGALKTGIAHAVRERRLGRIHCARDVLICWHRRWHRRQAVHTSLHGGVALKSGLAAGIVQLRVGNDGVRRVLGTATDRATDSLVRHRERRHRLHRARLGCGGSEGGGLHWRQSRSGASTEPRSQSTMPLWSMQQSDEMHLPRGRMAFGEMGYCPKVM